MAEKKKKKEKTTVNLPSISKSIKRSNDMAQGKANYNDGMKAVGIIIGILLVLFILLGGINQRAFVETMMNFAKTVGDKFTSWVDKGDVDITSDGIYIKPAGPDGGILTGHPDEAHPDTSSANTSQNTSNETSDDTSEETSDETSEYSR